jgi:hypothetical protein
MYETNYYMWVKVAMMHFVGCAEWWLQSMERRLGQLSWEEFCGLIHECESSLLGFGGLDDNPIKGLTSVLSVEQVLNAKLTGFNTSEQV